jgi:hypothetical protein
VHAREDRKQGQKSQVHRLHKSRLASVTAPGSEAGSLRQALTTCYWLRLGPSPANRQYLTAPKRG